MARNVADTGNIVDIKRGRGRPKGSTKPKVAAAAAKKAEEMISGKLPAPKNGIIEQDFLPDDPKPQALGEMRQTAPAFGANEPDESTFLKHVQILRKKQSEIDVAALTVKNLKREMKDLRSAAGEEGIVMGELNRALKDAETEDVDLAAREQRYLLYMQWLGKPVFEQAELDVNARQTPEQEAAYWGKRGEQAGRLGKNREHPEGTPPDRIQDWYHGYDRGQEALMRKSPLTAGAFKSDGVDNERRLPDLPEGSERAEVLILSEGSFKAGTELMDANRSTLFDDAAVAQFDAAEYVTAVFGNSRRILKEPGYVDDGSEETPVTEPEPAAPEEVATASVEAADLA